MVTKMLYSTTLNKKTMESLPQNKTIFVLMFTHGCIKCGPSQSCTCSAAFKTTVPPEYAVQSERTVSCTLFLGIMGGTIVVIIFVAMLASFKYSRKKISVTSKDLKKIYCLNPMTL